MIPTQNEGNEDEKRYTSTKSVKKEWNARRKKGFILKTVQNKKRGTLDVKTEGTDTVPSKVLTDTKKLQL